MLKKIVNDFLSFFWETLPSWARYLFMALLGAFLGLVIFLIHISNFFSYLSDDPKTCINCHIMVPQYVTWFHSSHREVATCNDCHVPHDNVFHQYFFKSQDGLRHSTIFTLRGEEQAITIKAAGKKAVQNNCIRCHGKIFEAAAGMPLTQKYIHKRTDSRTCTECHREVPHGTVRSLSATPFGKAPTTKSMIPDWLSKAIKEEKKDKK